MTQPSTSLQCPTGTPHVGAFRNWVRASLRRARTAGPAATREALRPLADELGRVLDLTPLEHTQVRELLPALAVAVAPHRLTREARVLFDLQAVCWEARRKDPIDFVDWIRTLGARPFRRPLPVLRELRVYRRLARVLAGLGSARVRVAEARDLASSLEPVILRHEERLRSSLSARLDQCLDDVGLSGGSVAEETARAGLVAQLVDRTLRRGRLDFGDVRDGIAHHPIKLRDLTLGELVRGDALLRLDRRLAEALDGVYYRGESYTRWLQRVQSLIFGTRFGRLAARTLLGPLLAATVCLEFVGYMLTSFGAAVEVTSLPAVLGLALLFALVLNVRRLRGLVIQALRSSWSALSSLAGRSAHRPSSEAEPVAAQSATRGLGVFVNGIVTSYHDLGDAMSSAFYLVEEQIHARAASRSVRVFEAALALVWFVLGYWLRFIMRVVVEPTINPVKHFPLVTVAGKICVASGLPVVITLNLAKTMPIGLAGSLGVLIGVFVIPAIAGFLAWELRYNYRLYAANRRKALAPVAVGLHGEPLLRLLRPGFHSGTLPKLTRRLGKAIHRHGRDSPQARALRHELDEITRAVRRFAQRDLVNVLAKSRSLSPHRLELTNVQLSHRRVVVSIGAAGALDPCEAVFEIEDRLLVAGLARHGFAPSLDPAARRALEAAWLGFFALAGVRRVRGAGDLSVPVAAWSQFWEDERAGTTGPLLASLRLLP